VTLWDPDSESSCKRLTCGGRTAGTNQLINANWGPYSYTLPDGTVSETYNNKRLYQTQDLYMWYQQDSGMWCAFYTHATPVLDCTTVFRMDLSVLTISTLRL
jgi:hypothetical protein